jgi:enoyl-CoA hydratase
MTTELTRALRVTVTDGVATVVLSRVERLNALTAAMLAELAELAVELARDGNVDAIVLAGEGRAFCAGLDIRELLSDGRRDVQRFLEFQEQVAHSVASVCRVPKPVIAAVNGPAVGGGFALALAADLRVASAPAGFSAPFIRLGLSGCDVGISWLLPRIVGLGHASDLLLTGRYVELEEAVRIGLVNRIAEPDELLDRAIEFAREVAAPGQLPTRLTKQALRVNAGAASLEAAIELENRNQALAAGGPSHAAALADFVRRHPNTIRES